MIILKADSVCKYESNSRHETENIAKQFAEALKPFDFVSLTGPLGAGKTAFVKGIAGFFCIEEGFEFNVSSPTFTIMNRYLCSIAINHFDFYRLKTAGDLENCGFFDSLDQNALTIAEWADKIYLDYKRYANGDFYTVNIEFADENSDSIHSGCFDKGLTEPGESKRYIKIEKI